MGGFALGDDTVGDLTSLITELGSPITRGSFSQVYRCTIGASKDTTEVAVRVIIIDHNRTMAKIEKTMRRELRVWFRLRHSTIVPLLGIAYVESPLPALVSQWMHSGTLNIYLEKQATALTASTRVTLTKGVADGLNYLHSENVVHGDLQPANVLIDDSGNPRLTGFGLATVVGDPELQLTTTTVDRSFDSRWRAPELIGVDCDPETPTFESDIYSFGSVMFFIISGDIPWKEKKRSHQISIELSRKATPARPENILDDPWNLIQRCWSWNPGHRPGATRIIEYIDQSRNDDSQASRPNPPPLPIVPLAEDLTGQIFGTIADYVASGAFANVYRCEWRRPSGPVKVAVKSFRHHIHQTSEQDLRRFRRETAIWARLVHDNIVALYGTTEGFGPTTSLVSPWFPDGTLLHLITKQGVKLTIRSKLKLLHGIASGLYYLHSFPIVHGDITSSNILVDLKDGEYKACLTDFGLSNVLCGRLKDRIRIVEESAVRPGAVRWTPPELLGPRDHPFDVKPTTHNDMYSYGRVMFHLLTLVIPWHDTDDLKVVQKILSGEDIQRPEISDATSHVTDARWDLIEQCWSVDPSARPSAFMAMDFIRIDLEALKQDESHQSEYLVAEQITASVPRIRRIQSQPTIMTTRRTQSFSRSLVPSLTQSAPSISLARHIVSTVSTLSLTGPLNVLLFGETGVGKSSIINLIMGRDAAQTSPDGECTTLSHTSYEVNLGIHRFKLWEVSSIESMGFFRSFFKKWRLKKAYKRLYKDDGVCLLLYCMRGSRAQRALLKDYKFFTDVVGSTAGPGRVPVAAVITSLEDHPTDMDNWWTKNKNNLELLGMQFSSHVCITSLPDDPNASSAMRARRHRSEQAIRKLIHDSYQAGRTHSNLMLMSTS